MGFNIGGLSSGDAPTGPAAPLPPLPWPNKPAVKRICQERGMPEQFTDLGVESVMAQIKQVGWTQEQLESYLQHGSTTPPAEGSTRWNKGPFPTLPQAHTYNRAELEELLDTVEVEVRLEVRALRNGDAAGAAAHHEAGKAAAKRMDEMMTPDPSTPHDLRFVNPRIGRGVTRGIYDAYVLSEGDDGPYKISRLRAVAGGTIALRSPSLQGGDDDFDNYAPFIDPFTYG